MRRLAIEGKRAVHNPAFDYALKKVSNHVIEASKQRYMSVMCELPEFVFGCPAFKVQACAKYVTEVLTLRGFQVQLVGEKVVLVSWAPAPRLAIAAPAAIGTKTATYDDDEAVGGLFSHLTL